MIADTCMYISKIFLSNIQRDKYVHSVDTSLYEYLKTRNFRAHMYMCYIKCVCRLINRIKSIRMK